MVEVTTRDELKRALREGDDTIHVADEKLCLGLMTRPRKNRSIKYMVQQNGYRQVTKKLLGSFDVTFIRVS